jgi:hypothetical protein
MNKKPQTNRLLKKKNTTTRIKTNVVQSWDVKIHGYIFFNKKMSRNNLCKSHLLVVMALCVANATTY